MPNFVMDEDKWSKAKDIAEKQGTRK